MIEWFDDLSLGMRFKSKEVHITRNDIRRFAAEFDPQLIKPPRSIASSKGSGRRFGVQLLSRCALPLRHDLSARIHLSVSASTTRVVGLRSDLGRADRGARPRSAHRALRASMTSHERQVRPFR